MRRALLALALVSLAGAALLACSSDVFGPPNDAAFDLSKDAPDFFPDLAVKVRDMPDLAVATGG